MSCKHGNSNSFCELCIAEDDAYEAGFDAGLSEGHRRIDNLEEALKDVTAHLAGATSAYETYAGKLGRKSAQDALFTTRLSDFNNALERARSTLKETK
jgi:hypothetical protein